MTRITIIGVGNATFAPMLLGEPPPRCAALDRTLLEVADRLPPSLEEAS